ncbi:MAG: 2-C-methyl-D-erythritol 2,4-cyclodiphosphate synthase, partial [Rickettsiales bacterium]
PPQGVLYQDILNSHIAFKDLNFTDDSSLNEYAGIPVAIVTGSQNNFKITTEEDYERAKMMITFLNEEYREETKVGIGYDVHAFEDLINLDTNLIRLGGTEIEFNKKIIAHSDGDVVIHAIIDAILGALGLGDIGEHFPPNDPKWKGCDSREMLKIIYNLVQKYSASIINIDTTIICERPKILKYKDKMKEEISTILGISSKKINIKATTTEGLGFTGRGEGIACQAVATLICQSNIAGR